MMRLGPRRGQGTFWQWYHGSSIPSAVHLNGELLIGRELSGAGESGPRERMCMCLYAPGTELGIWEVLR